jgi:hypothetical protein
MSTVYRITKKPEVGQLVDSTEALERFARENGPGFYHVDEHSLEPFEGSKHSARPWGTIIHRWNGRILAKPFFYGDHVAIGDE